MRLSALFSDHAVFQRGIPIPVWGWTRPSVSVTARLGNSKATVLSAPDGRFLLRLPPRQAGGPYALTVDAAGKRITVKDVLVGEVWLASGQSNMQWRLADCGPQGDRAIGSSARSGVRMFTVPRLAKIGGQADAAGDWQVASPETAGEFSAVAYHFAARLRKALRVPVGIIHASWGGTFVETWASREALIGNPDTRAWTERYEADLYSPEYWNGAAADAPYPADPGNRGERKGWARTDFDDSEWARMDLPRHWQESGHAHSGVFWFRRAVQVPAAWAGRDLELRIGAVDKHDTTWFNGVKVGATGKDFEVTHWNAPRNYAVPGRLVKAGRNVVAVRAYSFIYDGGMIGPAAQMRLGPASAGGRAIPLAGEWRYRVEHDFGLVQIAAARMGPETPNTPYMLYENMIRPLAPYGIGGAIWYQGESNANGNDRNYSGKLAALIRDWRRGWGQGDFPFLQVQLANFREASPHQEKSAWARLREEQTRVLAEPRTGLAVTIDIGQANDIHPKNKRDVGLRLAQWALAEFFGRPGPASGPLYAGMTIEGPRIRLRFDHVGAGLVAKGKGGGLRKGERQGKKDGQRRHELACFVVAGPDRRFVPAEAWIEGETVVVRSRELKAPVAVRYAWADNPQGCNLYNRDGLPASPFRTDVW